MANAKKDQNGVSALIAVLNTNGTTITVVKANPANHALKAVNAATGSDNGPTRALHDENSVPVIIAVSSADGITPIPIYADSSGNLLIKST